MTGLQWFNAELRKAQSLTAVLVGELCKAAYDILEAAAPLTYKQQGFYAWTLTTTVVADYTQTPRLLANNAMHLRRQLKVTDNSRD